MKRRECTLAASRYSGRKSIPCSLALIPALVCALYNPALAAPFGHDAYQLSEKDGYCVSYELTPLIDSVPEALTVSMTFQVGGNPAAVEVQMPVWSPGDYHVQNHAQFVQEFHSFAVGADGSEHALMTRHPDPNTWEIETGGATTLRVRYALPTTPPGNFSENVQLTPHFAFVNGAGALVYLVGHKDAASMLSVHLPNGWKAVTSLPEPKATQDNDHNRFLAPDYDTLADSPVVMADAQGMTVTAFQQDGVDYRVVLFRHPDQERNLPELLSTLQKVSHAEAMLMGGMPTTKYAFLFDVDGFAAGLEHLNSFRIGLPGNLPQKWAAPFIAHEFFHLWNVKRIRPEVLGPFDYIHPPHTRNLWFAEGVTEYYAQLCTQRAGLTTTDGYLAHYRNAIRALQRNPARGIVTADEASLKVWDTPDSQGFAGLSYYEKGELIGLCLDLKIRAVTGGKRSLDDVMRLLMKRHNPPLPGYGEDELRDIVSEVAGKDLSDFYNLLARSTKEMPFADCLAPFGLGVDLRPLATETPDQKALRAGWLEGKPHD